MSPLTTHVLDTARGCPAAGVPVRLELEESPGQFAELARGVTNQDGRLPDLVAPGSLRAAVYRITFDIETYESARGTRGFYPYAQIVFRVTDPSTHHHVPLLLSPFGYSTYRGS